MENLRIDKTDKEIITHLMQDATMPYTDLARKLNVSSGTIHVRMKKLKDLGVVSGSTLKINPAKIGFDICAFVGVFLEKGTYYKHALYKFKDIPEIVELHYTTGTYSVFIKLICKDTQNLRRVLNEKIQTIAGVQRTETFISLEESIRRQIKIT